VVLSNFAEIHALDQFAEAIAVLWRDNWSSDITSEMVDFLIEKQVYLPTFVLFTTHIFELFDLTLFYGFKQHPRYELALGDGEVTIKLLMKVCHGFRQITVDSNI
jgi:hypothetical protein